MGWNARRLIIIVIGEDVGDSQRQIEVPKTIKSRINVFESHSKKSCNLSNSHALDSYDFSPEIPHKEDQQR